MIPPVLTPDEPCYVGGTISPRITFRDPQTGDLFDPDAVTLTVKKPSGTTVTYSYSATITRDSLGQYTKYDMPLTEANKWVGTWSATRSDAVIERAFQFTVYPIPVS